MDLSISDNTLWAIALAMIILTATPAGIGSSSAELSTEYSIDITGSMDVPAQTVEAEFGEATISEVGKEEAGNILGVSTNALANETYAIRVIEIVDGDRRNLATNFIQDGDTETEFSLFGYDPGTYLVALTQDGGDTAVAFEQFVVKGYAVDQSVSNVTKGDIVNVDIQLTEVNNRAGNPQAVNVTLYGNNVTRSTKATKTSKNSYQANFPTNELSTGSYNVYAGVETNSTVFGNNELIGLSDSTSVTIGSNERHPQTDIDTSDLPGDGTSTNPYEISNVSELQAIEDDLDANYELVSDIDASQTAQFNDGAGFDPVGTDRISTSFDDRFTGSFDGNNHTISELIINRPDESNVGLFGVSAGELIHIHLNEIKVTGDNDVGGLVGRNDFGDVRNARVSGNVTGTNDVGGLIGLNRKGTIKNAQASGGVIGNTRVGGLAGHNDDGTIQRAAVFNDITGSQSFIDSSGVGGLVGFASESSTIQDTFAVGHVSGQASAGGLVGSIENRLESEVIEDSYWNKQSTGQSYSDGDATGLTTAKMQGQAAAFEMSALNFVDTWQVTGGYPELQTSSPTEQEGILIQIDNPTAVAAGDTFVVDATITNTNSASETQTVELSTDGTRRDTAQLTLSPGQITTVPLMWQTTADEAGEYTVSVSSANNTVTTTVSVNSLGIGETTNDWQSETITYGSEPDISLHGQSLNVGFSANDIRHATLDRDGWSNEVIDSTVRERDAYSGGSGQEKSLAVDSTGDSHIAYTYNYLRPNRVSELRYARESNSSWDVNKLVESATDDPISIDINPSTGRPVTLLPSSGYLQSGELALAKRSGDTWTKETQNLSGRQINQDSLIYDSTGRPHVLYAEQTTGQSNYSVFHAIKDGDSWDISTIAGPRSSDRFDFALDSDGTPHVLYVSENGDLIHANQNETGWEYNVARSTNATTDVREFSLASGGNTVHISYVIATRPVENRFFPRNYSTWYGEYFSGQWQQQRILLNLDDTRYNSIDIAATETGTPHIVAEDGLHLQHITPSTAEISSPTRPASLRIEQLSSDAVAGDIKKYDIILQNSTGGVGGYNMTLSLSNSAVANFTDTEFDGSFSQTTIADRTNATSVRRYQSADQDKIRISTSGGTIEESGSVTIATFGLKTVQSGTTAINLSLNTAPDVIDREFNMADGSETVESWEIVTKDNRPYTVSNITNATVSVVEPQPTGSIHFNNQTVPNGSTTVTVDSAQFGNQSLPGEDFVVVVHETTQSTYGTEIGAKVGESDVLSAGNQTNITVDLTTTLGSTDSLTELTNSQSLVAMLHRAHTTDGNNVDHGDHITRDGATVTSRAQITVSSSDSGDVLQVDVDPSDLPGDGTESDPYEISNVSELQAMEDDLDANYELVSDINASQTAQWNNGSGFDPVGTPVEAFSGSLDGNNQAITGLTINRSDETGVGLFAHSSGTVTDILLTQITVTGDYDVGGLVGEYIESNGNITNATVLGSVSGTQVVGALIGENHGNITNVTASGSTSIINNIGGGLVGYNDGVVTSAKASVNMNGSGSIGGLVGSNLGKVTNSSASGSVTGSLSVGGLVGTNSDDGTITNAIASGSVTATGEFGSAGGLAGRNSGRVQNTLAVGSVSGKNSLGGLVGDNSGTVAESYFDTQATEESTSAGSAIGLTTAQMQGRVAISNMSGFDFQRTWKTTDGYPTLRVLSEADEGSGSGGPIQVDVDPSDLPGDGTESNPYEISNISELQAMEDDLDANYELVSDIDASQTAQFNNGSGFDPVGGDPDNESAPPPFNGSLNGNNYTVVGLTIDRPNERYVGLFGVTGNGATIRDTTFTTVTVIGNSGVGGVAGESRGTVSGTVVSGSVNGTGGTAGGLVGTNDGTIQNTRASVSVTGNSRVGGLVVMNRGTIQNATASGSVSGGDEVGGLIAYNDNPSQIENVRASGNVTGMQSVGGLVGFNNRKITNARASGNVTGTEQVGGLVGDNGGAIQNATATGSVNGTEQVGGLVGNHNFRSILSVTASGSVTGNSRVGGLVGENSEGVIAATASGNVTGERFVGGLAGVNTGGIATARATGSVTGQQNVGGLVGGNGGAIHQTFAVGSVSGGADTDSGGLVGNNTVERTFESVTGIVQQSYFDTRTTDQSTSAGSVTDLTTAQMQGQAAVTNMSGLTFGTNWQTQPDDYPTVSETQLLQDVDMTDLNGNGTESDPYEISNVSELQAIEDRDDGNYELVSDIDASNTAQANAGRGFNPIDVSGGSFDGNSHTITGLTINRPGESGVGLFSVVDNGVTIKNITLANVTVTGEQRVGGLVGDNDGSIQNARASGNVTATRGFAAGGLVGNNGGVIQNATASGSVTGTREVGGLVGFNQDATIQTARASGSVTATGESGTAGGLVGGNGRGGKIQTARASGSVTATGEFGTAGGLVGRNKDGGTIRDTFAVGSVSGVDDVGGLTGNDFGAVEESYFDTQTTGQTTSTSPATGLTTAQMQGQASEQNMEFAFGGEWQIQTDPVNYPVLTAFRPEQPEPSLRVLSIDEQGANVEIVEGTDVNVSVNVSNTGEVASNFTVSLDIGSGEATRVQNISVDTDSTRKVTFRSVTSTLPAGDFSVNVSIADDSLTGNLTILEPAQPDLADLSIAGEGAEAEIIEGADANVSVDVTNIGDITRNFTVTAEVGQVNQSLTTETLQANATEQLVFDELNTSGLPAREAPFILNVLTANDSLTDNLSVLEAGQANLTELSIAKEGTEAEIVEDTNTTVSVNVSNVGDVTENFTVTTQIGETPTQRLMVTLSPGTTQRLTFDELNTSTLSTRNDSVNVSVSTSTDSLSGSLTVLEPSQIDLTNLSVAGENTNAEIIQGTDSNITLIVRNSGDVAGKFALQLTVGSNTRTRNVTTSPTTPRTVIFSNVTETLSAGEYLVTLSAGSESTSQNLTVSSPTPPASVNFSDQTVSNGTSRLTVESATFGNQSVRGGDFVVVIHETQAKNGSIETKIGESAVLTSGTHTGITVNLSRSVDNNDTVEQLTDSQQLVAMLHRANTTNGESRNHGIALTRGNSPVTNRAQITVNETNDAQATLAVQPQSGKVQPNGTVSIAILANTTEPLAGVSASIQYNTSLFDADVSSGSFLSSDGADTNTPVPPSVNETAGIINYSEFRLANTGIRGSGPLFVILLEPTQSVTRGVQTSLTLADASLSDTDEQPIATQLDGGTVTIPENTPPTLNATLQTTTNNVGAPLTVEVNATDAETAVDAIVFTHGNTTLQSQSRSQGQRRVELATTPTESSWVGESYDPRNYTITVSDTEGLATTETIQTPIYIPGDTNGDGIVDIFDAVAIGSSWQAQRGQDSYESKADLNNDGVIDIFDAVAIGSNWRRQAQVNSGSSSSVSKTQTVETGVASAIGGPDSMSSSTGTTADTDADADTGAVVSVTPQTTQIPTNATDPLSVDVVVNTTQPLAGVEASLQYDTSVLNATVSGGPFLSSDGADTNTPVPPTVNETTGTVSYSEFRLTPEGITGNGTLFTVTFEPTEATPDSQLSLTGVSLSEPDQDSIATQLQNGTVTTNPTNNRTDASVIFKNQSVSNGSTSVTIGSATFNGSSQFNVVVHEASDADGDGTIQADEIGTKIGDSVALENGTTTDIAVDISDEVDENDTVSQLTESQTLVAMLHTTNTTPSDEDSVVHAAPITRNGTPVFDQATVTVEKSPITAVQFQNQTVLNGSTTVTVESAQFGNQSVRGKDFVVVVHETDDGDIGTKIGESAVIAGNQTNSNITVNLSKQVETNDDVVQLTESQQLIAMLHLADTGDGDNINHGANNLSADTPTPVTDRAQVGPLGLQTVEVNRTAINQPGQPVKINAVVSNEGATENSIQLALRDRDTEQPLFNVSVASETTRTVSFNVTPAQTETFSIQGPASTQNVTIDVAELALEDATLATQQPVTTDDTVVVNATVANTGTATGFVPLTLRQNGSVLNSTTQEVPADSTVTAQLQFTTSLDEGTQNLTVTSSLDNQSATVGEVVVAPPEAVTDATVRVGSESVGPGGTATVNLTLDQAPQGLAGYNLTARLSVADSGVRVVDATAPTVFNDSVTETTMGLANQTAEIRATDITEVVEPNTTNISLGEVTVAANESANVSQTELTVSVERIDDDSGTPINVTTQNGTVTVREQGPLAPGLNPPTDPDGDGVFEDVNGNGRLDFNDVVILFDNLPDAEVQFQDVNGNGRIDFDDIVELFGKI